MTRSRLKKFERRLLSEHRYLTASIAAANERARETERAAEDEVLGPGYGAEDAGTIVARQLDALVADRETRELQEIDAALRLLYRHPERYGHCVKCGAEIAEERLEFVPWTQRCGRHQERSEHSERAVRQTARVG